MKKLMKIISLLAVLVCASSIYAADWNPKTKVDARLQQLRQMDVFNAFTNLTHDLDKNEKLDGRLSVLFKDKANEVIVNILGYAQGNKFDPELVQVAQDAYPLFGKLMSAIAYYRNYRGGTVPTVEAAQKNLAKVTVEVLALNKKFQDLKTKKTSFTSSLTQTDPTNLKALLEKELDWMKEIAETEYKRATVELAKKKNQPVEWTAAKIKEYLGSPTDPNFEQRAKSLIKKRYNEAGTSDTIDVMDAIKASKAQATIIKRLKDYSASLPLKF